MTAIKELEQVITNKDFSNQDFSVLDNLISKLNDKGTAATTKLEVSELLGKLKPDATEDDCIIFHSRLKPYGYSGDFELIEKLYTRHISDKGPMNIWDQYLHECTAPKAVRNRKEYFKNIVNALLKTKKESRLLNLASGPARDLKEVYEKINNPSTLKTTCVEMDEAAINYASKLTAPYKDQIQYIRKNILRYNTNEKYDLIWSAGLFDYFDDKAFVLMLKRFKSWVAPGGSIVIGNFNEDHNPSREFMELFGDWYLNHRSADHLRVLAQEAGYDIENISIGREPENVNLFLHITL